MDKFGGSLAGVRGPAAAGGAMDVATAADAATLGELLVDGASGDVLRGTLGADGAVVWRRVGSSAEVDAATARVIAQSQMASMLRDGGRNAAWAAAIARAVGGRPAAPRVLDIGAGTGLLSLLAARAGAAHVVACEQWAPMARVASEVVAANGAASVVTIHALHSGALPAPPQADAADVVVSEILDSALLGEGVVPALRDAYARLASPAAACVPVRARLVAQLVSCPAVRSWHGTAGAAVRCPAGHPGGGGAPPLELPLYRTDWAPTCPARCPALPVHADRLPSLVPVTPPFTAARLDFTRGGIAAWAGAHAAPHVTVVPSLTPAPGCSTAAAPAEADALLFWWDAVLAEDGDPASGGGGAAAAAVTYTTEPRAGAAAHGWQDHWVQCLVPLAAPVAAQSRHGGHGGQPPVPAADAEKAAAAAAWLPAVVSVDDADVEGVRSAADWSRAAAGASAEPAARGAIAVPAGVFTVSVSVGELAADWVVAGGVPTAVWPSKRARALAARAGAFRADDNSSAAAAVPMFIEPSPCVCGLHTSLASHERRAALADAAWGGAFARGVDAAMRGVLTSRSPATAAAAVDGEGAARARVVDGAAVEHCGSEAGSGGIGEAAEVRVLCYGEGGLCAVAAVASAAAMAAVAAAVGAPPPSPLQLTVVEPSHEGAVHTTAVLDAAIAAVAAVATAREAGGGNDGDDGASASTHTLGPASVAGHAVVVVPPGAAFVAGLVAVMTGAGDDDEVDDDDGGGDSGDDDVLGSVPVDADVDVDVGGSGGGDDDADAGVAVGETCGDAGDAVAGGDGDVDGTVDAARASDALAADDDDAGAVEATRVHGPVPRFDALLMEPYVRALGPSPLAAATHLLLRAAALGPLLAPHAAVVPGAAVLRAQAVRISELYASHGAVGAPCGFSHAAFDAIEVAEWWRPLYTYPLWQYRHAAVGAVVDVARLDFAGAAAAAREAAAAHAGGDGEGGDPAGRPGGAALPAATVPLFAPAAGPLAPGVDAGAKMFNAVLLWVDYDVGGGAFASTGLPVGWADGAPGAAPPAMPAARQAVKFLPAPTAATADVRLHVDLGGFVTGGDAVVDVTVMGEAPT